MQEGCAECLGAQLIDFQPQLEARYPLLWLL
jgi:hypothetical protein